MDGDPRALRRAVDRGRLVRLRRGAFIDARVWVSLSVEERYRARIWGSVGSRDGGPVVSHVSAAFLRGAPLVGPVPTLVHVLTTRAAGTRTEQGYRKHATAYPDEGVETRDGVRMTCLTRALAETAAESPFLTAVGILDWAFASHGISAAAVLGALDDYGIVRGRRRAARAISFADARSGSPGETLSRVRIHEAGLPAPELQAPFRDADGLIGFVDFWWPEHQLIGEFDGVAKYVRDDYSGGLSPADIVIAEKIREDRLRSLGPQVVRWGWDLAREPTGLADRLASRGLPRGRRRPT